MKKVQGRIMQTWFLNTQASQSSQFRTQGILFDIFIFQVINGEFKWENSYISVLIYCSKATRYFIQQISSDDEHA